MSEIHTYRKIPIVVEAWQFDGTKTVSEAICAWANENGAQAVYEPFLADHFRGDPKVYVAHPDPFLRIVTPGGTMIANPGDWVIMGVSNEFYTCKPDIFEATYELVETSPETTDLAIEIPPFLGGFDGEFNIDILDEIVATDAPSEEAEEL